MQHEDIRRAIAALGTEIAPTSLHTVHELYQGEQRRIATAIPPLASDLSYGPDERNRLDLYAPTAPSGLLPVLAWVHGGGFRRGSKGGGEEWQDAKVGRMAVQEGLLGVVINYRLTPQHTWPSGSEDLALLVSWLKREVRHYGGDPERIFLAGSSAGAAHVAGYLKHTAGSRDLAGAIMLSGLYGAVEMADERDLGYYGEDRARHAEMVPLDAVVDTEIPLLVACAEFDPPRFQQEFLTVMQRRLERHGTMSRGYIASGHNHFSLAYHLGTSDRRISDEIVSFVRSPAD